MASFTSQSIQSSYQRVLQIESGSILQDGTGSQVVFLDLTSSFSTSASYASSLGTGVTSSAAPMTLIGYVSTMVGGIQVWLPHYSSP